MYNILEIKYVNGALWILNLKNSLVLVEKILINEYSWKLLNIVKIMYTSFIYHLFFIIIIV